MHHYKTTDFNCLIKATNHNLITPHNYCHYSVMLVTCLIFYVARPLQILVEYPWFRQFLRTFQIMLMMLMTQCLNLHLFNGHMLPMVVQPYRNFWGETELSNGSEKIKDNIFLTQRRCMSKNWIIVWLCYDKTVNAFSGIPEINRLVRRRGGASRGRALFTVCRLYRSSEIGTQSSARLCFLWRLLSSVCFHYQTMAGYTLYTYA